MLIPHQCYVMTVDGANRSLFRNSGSVQEPRLQLVENDEHKSPRTSAMGDDRPGRSFQSVGQHRSATEQTDWHQQAEEDFARKAADALTALLADGQSRAILVADPRVLGIMRGHLSAATSKHLIAEIPKNYAGLNGHELTDLLKDYEP